MSRHSKDRPEEKGRPLQPPFRRDAGDVRATRDEDRLVELLGAQSLRHLDPEDPANAPFFEWLAHELRESLSSAERRDLEERASDFAARMQTRLAAGGGAIRFVGASAPTRTPSVSGTVPDVLGHAVAERCAPCVELGVAAGIGRDIWDEPCAAWVELPEEIPEGRYVALTVSGESMEPLLHTGDTILVKLGPALVRDAVVVARHPDDGYVVKRVSCIGRRTIQLASLNPSYGPVEVPRRDDLVVGTVVLRWCTHGVAAPASQ